MMEILNLIKSVPSAMWTGMVGTLIGSSLTVVGVFLTNRSNNKRLVTQLQHENSIRKQDIQRERLEELYVESKKYLNSLGSHYLPYKKVMKGELTFNQALDLTIESCSKMDYDPHIVTMIIDLYFPELQQPLDKIMKIRELLNQIVDGYKEQYKNGETDGGKWLAPFQDSLDNYVQAVKEFESLVAAIKIQ